jgi:hypothetical protein
MKRISIFTDIDELIDFIEIDVAIAVIIDIVEVFHCH